jgi:CoA:oxalate CoA-transferase
MDPPPFPRTFIMTTAATTRSPLPLDGITIIDMTHVLAGPYATLILRHLGARVIKIERPGSGDDARAFGPFVDGQSTYFTALNSGKESVAIDLEKASDLALLHRLIGRADVLVENFRPGVMQRHGLDYASLRQRYPGLIYGSITGFGQDGPYRERPAYDVIVQAMSGMMSVTGQPGGEPARVGVSIGDMAAGVYMAIGLCAALFGRTRTGLGRYVDVAMLDCQVALLENDVTSYLATGRLPRPLGTRHPSVAPFAAFGASDTHIAIAAANDALFNKLCVAIERTDLLHDERFRSNELRLEHVDALTAELEKTLATATADTWTERLQQAGIPCGPLNTLADVVKDPQLAARHMILPVQGTPFQVAGNPIKFGGLPEAASYPAAPGLDADRERLVREFMPEEAMLP